MRVELTPSQVGLLLEMVEQVQVKGTEAMEAVLALKRVLTQAKQGQVKEVTQPK